VRGEIKKISDHRLGNSTFRIEKIKIKNQIKHQIKHQGSSHSASFS
jgi:hypothetical protein